MNFKTNNFTETVRTEQLAQLDGGSQVANQFLDLPTVANVGG